MRIGLISPEFPPDTIGGGGTVFEALALGLHERGHSVKVVTAATWRGAPPRDERYPFPILRVPEFRHFSEQFRTYMPPQPHYLPGVRRFLADREVFSLHGYGMPFVDAAFLFAVAKHRSVFTTHGFPYTARVCGGLLAAAYSIYDAAIGKRILLESAALTAVSTLLAHETQAVAHRSVRVIPNGISQFSEHVVPLPDLESEASRGPYVLCVGRLESLKGFDNALRIVARLREAGDGLRLLFAGSDSGEERKLLALAGSLGIASAVSFLGRIQRDQLAWLYRRAAAVLVTSVTESFSLVTLEAMSQGAACVLSAVGGILDIARDGENAMLYPFGDLDAAVERITRLRADRPLNTRLRHNARATTSQFSWPRIIGQYEAVFEDVARR